MASVSAVIFCDGGVLSFGCWTLVGVTRTVWGEALPFDGSFGLYLLLTDVRAKVKVEVELHDPVGAAQGETGSLKWRKDFRLQGSAKEQDFERYFQTESINFVRAIDHELHLKVDGKLLQVAILSVVA